LYVRLRMMKISAMTAGNTNRNVRAARTWCSNSPLHSMCTPSGSLTFRLRTMIVAVVVLSIPLAWVGYSLNWIRVRQRWFYAEGHDFIYDGPSVLAPAGLGIFGESGNRVIACSKAEYDHAVALFPEATIFHVDGEKVRRSSGE